MVIALFSDIHANLPAFEAILADLDRRKPDAVYCLGDLIGYNVWPNEIISEVRKRGIATLKGNHDLKTTGYAYKLVSPDNRRFLNTLPEHINLEYQFKEKLNILMAHGSPRAIDEYMLIDTDERYIRDMMEEHNAHVLCVGHSHKPFHRIIAGTKHLINIGSVGKPKDRNPDLCYVLLHISSQGEIYPEFIRVTYDVEKQRGP